MYSKKWILILTALPLFVLAVFWGYRQNRLASASPGEATPATPPVLVPVTRGNVTLEILAPGQLVSTREMVLSSLEGGLVEEIGAQPGSPVEEGEVIARLSGPGAEVRAPFTGVIAEVFARAGETLPPGQGLALLVDPQALEVRATVIEEDLPLVKVGQPAELYFDALPDMVRTGRVTRIVPVRVPREDRPLYYVFLSIEGGAPGLASGMTADAAIIVAEARDALRLPRGLLRGGSGDTASARVWVDGEIQDRQVQTGLRGSGYIEILSGLSEGEQVIGE
jgi:multidrug efflux pump subunit AcrA (membrane-fusion protein)